MIRVGKLIEELQKFPIDALAYGYEGDIVGLVISAAEKNEHGYRDVLGHIPATEKDTDSDGPAVFEGRIMEKIGTAKEIILGSGLNKESDIVLTNLNYGKAVKGEKILMLDSRVSCPHCGTGIAVHIEKKI